MKKLMIVAAVALCAAYANAAAFTWKASANMTDNNGTTLASMSPAGTLALVYLGNDSSDVDWTKAKVVDSTTPNFTSSMGKTSATTSKSFVFDMADYGNGHQCACHHPRGTASHSGKREERVEESISAEGRTRE